MIQPRDIKLAFPGGTEIVFVDADTGCPVSLIIVDTFLTYYREVSRHQAAEIERLTAQLAQSWPGRMEVLGNVSKSG